MKTEVLLQVRMDWNANGNEKIFCKENSFKRHNKITEALLMNLLGRGGLSTNDFDSNSIIKRVNYCLCKTKVTIKFVDQVLDFMYVGQILHLYTLC